MKTPSGLADLKAFEIFVSLVTVLSGGKLTTLGVRGVQSPSAMTANGPEALKMGVNAWAGCNVPVLLTTST